MSQSGHYDYLTSEYASKYLIKEVDIQVSAVIGKNPKILGETIPTCLVDTIEKFDAMMRAMRPLRRASAGTTLLIAVIIEHDIWVASLGDSEGCGSTSSSME